MECVKSQSPIIKLDTRFKEWNVQNSNAHNKTRSRARAKKLSMNTNYNAKKFLPIFIEKLSLTLNQVGG